MSRFLPARIIPLEAEKANLKSKKRRSELNSHRQSVKHNTVMKIYEQQTNSQKSLFMQTKYVGRISPPQAPRDNYLKRSRIGDFEKLSSARQSFQDFNSEKSVSQLNMTGRVSPKPKLPMIDSKMLSGNAS